MRFNGKVALVTGGGSGIGQAAALAFAREGASVVVAGRSADRLAETVARVEQAGGQASALTANVASPTDVERMVSQTIALHGGLDVAFNNAGTVAFGPLVEMGHEDWAQLVATNVTGVFNCLKEEVAHMRQRGGGVIVNMSSNLGMHVRAPRLAAYAATKAAVSVLTRAAAKEYVRDGVRINAISPGPIDTALSYGPGESTDHRTDRIASMVPIGRIGTVEEAAAAVLWLASDDARFIVGHDLVIDGGVAA